MIKSMKFASHKIVAIKNKRNFAFDFFLSHTCTCANSMLDIRYVEWRRNEQDKLDPYLHRSYKVMGNAQI